MDPPTWYNWWFVALTFVWGWNFWQQQQESKRLEQHRKRLLAWSDSLDDCRRAVGNLYDMLAERYPDDADIEKCREIFAGRYSQH